MSLQVAHLDAWYGLAHILYDVSLQVERGECVALLGQNGAGKSTTLRAVMGLVPAVRGRVTLEGRAITGAAPHAIAHRGLGYTPEDRRLFPELTVRENLEVGRQPPRADAPAWDEARIFALFPQLEPLARRRAGSLSGGEQQMLAIARTLMGNPGTLLLDEPSEGLAPLIVEHLGQTIARLKGEGLGVLLCEQNFHFARWVCDRAYIIERGRIRYENAMAALARDRETLRTYLMV